MKIVFVTHAYSKNMGYITNCLPKAMAKLGHEVHVVAPNVQVYHSAPMYKTSYESFLGPGVVDVGVETFAGITLHRLPHKMYKRETKFYIKDLRQKLKELDPDVVQIFQVETLITWQVVIVKWFLGFKLFSANHVLESIFPMANTWENESVMKKLLWIMKHKLAGRFISLFVEKFYNQTEDARNIATKFYGASVKKSVIDPLGVDTDLFVPSSELNIKLRQELGYSEQDKICIYTGRFSEGKSPLVLAQAVDFISKEKSNIHALFLGNGDQEEEIKKLKNCKVIPFVKFSELAAYYQICDIGVWPREESTSMLDAMASGLPIIMNDTVTATERVEGNGAMYRENDYKDLASKILTILEDPVKYKEMSNFGVDKIQAYYSWDSIAKKRQKDYQIALNIH